MRVIVRDKGEEINFKIPNYLISMILSIGPVAAKFDNDSNKNKIDKNDLKALCKIAKEMAKEYKDFEIVNIVSNDGSEVSILV